MDVSIKRGALLDRLERARTQAMELLVGMEEDMKQLRALEEGEDVHIQPAKQVHAMAPLSGEDREKLLMYPGTNCNHLNEDGKSFVKRCIALGMGNKAIADVLSIHARSVRKYRA